MIRTGSKKAARLFPDVSLHHRADVKNESPGWLQIVLAMAHQDVNLYVLVLLSRGSARYERHMIHADMPC